MVDVAWLGLFVVRAGTFIPIISQLAPVRVSSGLWPLRRSFQQISASTYGARSASQPLKQMKKKFFFFFSAARVAVSLSLFLAPPFLVQCQLQYHRAVALNGAQKYRPRLEQGGGNTLLRVQAAALCARNIRPRSRLSVSAVMSRAP